MSKSSHRSDAVMEEEFGFPSGYYEDTRAVDEAFLAATAVSSPLPSVASMAAQNGERCFVNSSSLFRVFELFVPVRDEFQCNSSA